MARACQWLTVATAIAMLALAFGFAAFLLGFVGSLPLIAIAMAVRRCSGGDRCGATSSGYC